MKVDKLIHHEDIEEKVVPITYLRRHLGKILTDLPNTGNLFIAKDSRIIAEIIPKKRVVSKKTKTRAETLMKFAGLWKGTPLDDDSLWKKVLTRDSKLPPKF